MSAKREVAVVRHSQFTRASYGTMEHGEGMQYSVRYRETAPVMWGLWHSWGDWQQVVDTGDTSHWLYTTARHIANQALANGVVPSRYASQVHAVIELDQEEV